MKRIIIFLIASALPWYSGLAQTNIVSDYDAGLPFTQIIDNSLNEGNTLTGIFAQLLEITPEESGIVLSTAISVDSNQTADLLDIALYSGMDLALAVKLAVQAAPEQAIAIIKVAKKYGENELTIITTAIEAGADPSVVGEESEFWPIVLAGLAAVASAAAIVSTFCQFYDCNPSPSPPTCIHITIINNNCPSPN